MLNNLKKYTIIHKKTQMKGMVYRLWSLEGDLVYIGSTIQKLCWRLSYHKSHLNCSSKILFETYKVVKIELIEIIEYTDKHELIAREGHFIRTLDCVNKVIPDRTRKEYRDTHKEQSKDYMKTYNPEYQKNNKEYLKEQAKEYRETNEEIIKLKKKEWYENNKEKILKRQNQIITCECGCEITKVNLTCHKKSLKHLKLIQDIFV